MPKKIWYLGVTNMEKSISLLAGIKEAGKAARCFTPRE
jgi:hypothetical protein